MMFPVMEATLQIYGTFYAFALVILLFAPLVYYILPETKDLGLEDIQRYFLPAKTIFYVDLDAAGTNGAEAPKCPTQTDTAPQSES